MALLSVGIVCAPACLRSRLRLADTGAALALAIAVLCSAPGLLLAAPDFPALSGRVVDQAKLLDQASTASLQAQLEAHEAASGNQLVVVTLNDLQGYAISDYANQLGRHWEIGQADRNNGVLLLVARQERKVRIEVGYGLEGALTDAASADIIRRQILPHFREGDYSAGIQGGVDSIISAIKGEYTVPAQSADGKTRSVLKNYFPLFFIALIALFEVLKRLGLRKLGVSAFPSAIAGIAITAITNNMLYGLLAAGFVFLLLFLTGKTGGNGTGSNGTTHSSYQRPGDNHSHSSGGGGGFSGGGGSFGGGGASGSW